MGHCNDGQENCKIYIAKICFVILLFIIAELVIWLVAIKDESSDWIAEQVVHKVSHYAISSGENETIISNVVDNFEFSLLKEWNVTNNNNFSFYLKDDKDSAFCLVNIKINKTKKDFDLKQALKQYPQSKLIDFGNTQALETDYQERNNDKLVKNIIIKLKNNKELKFIIFSNKDKKRLCQDKIDFMSMSFFLKE